METSFGPIMFVGAALFFSGTLTAVVLVFVSSQLGIGMKGWNNMVAFFTRHPSARVVMGLAIVASLCGGVTTMGSVFVSDAERNQQCRQACERIGFNDGRYRGNPHQNHEPGSPYACWCEGASGWSAEPVDF